MQYAFSCDTEETASLPFEYEHGGSAKKRYLSQDGDIYQP